MFDDFYGLKGKPFQLTPDPAFYFPSGTHRKALSYLRYGLAQGEGFIVITGEVGAGKSTLVAHLVASVDPAQLTVGQVVTSKLDGEEIVHVVAQSFGLDISGHDKASALGAIEGFLHEEARSGRRCLLIVDESQNLSVAALEELRMLSNFQLGSHPLLQTLLLGQPEFRAMLQSEGGLEQLRQRVIAAHHLEPMDASEIEPYVVHRLKHVGWEGTNPSFDQRVFAELYQASGGIPRRINQIANRLLLLGAVEQRSRIDAAMLHAVLAEMDSDNAFPAAAPVVQPRSAAQVERAAQADAQPAASQPAPAQPAPVPGVRPDVFERALAQRDAQIAELQQAIVELSYSKDDATAAAVQPDIAALHDRISQLEARLIEQERTIRHTLTMLIEWIENDAAAQIAA
ncbi:general secretion pathway protein [Erythrobacter sp. SG61-1L]|uniref:XrtA/PEP-CTERM system-associated ATPase n=1 Tax=Erythrobacter sp. SG61-1L TaxID=1603897 RepID=UPI0006C92719|nr:XrtA/PEP-CTERM system-associated ATPase [Erythrobacter sp. SG61-1L]KPL67486.1 general secretion pathway protein [Erythrobacter sp. SG61-1L]